MGLGAAGRTGCAAGALEGSDDRAKLTDAGFEAVEVADTRPSGGGREAGEESGLPRPELPAQIDGRLMSGVSEVPRARRRRGVATRGPGDRAVGRQAADGWDLR